MRCTLDSDGDGYPDVALLDSPECNDPEGTQQLFCIQVLVRNKLGVFSKLQLAAIHHMTLYKILWLWELLHLLLEMYTST